MTEYITITLTDAEIARFWSRVAKVDGDGCWIWQTKNGPATYYAHFTVYREGHPYGFTAHRLSYELTYGEEIPEGMYGCHHCDNPPCVRPDHIFVGTASDNMNDAIRKGRMSNGNYCGPNHPNARVTQAMIDRMRAAFLRGTVKPGYYASRYGIGYWLAWDICNGVRTRPLLVVDPNDAAA